MRISAEKGIISVADSNLFPPFVFVRGDGANIKTRQLCVVFFLCLDLPGASKLVTKGRGLNTHGQRITAEPSKLNPDLRMGVSG